MDKNEKKATTFSFKDFLCQPVKNEGKALNTIFVLCLICIIGFSIYLYRVSTNFYAKIDETIQNNVNLNIEIMTNERIQSIESILNKI